MVLRKYPSKQNRIDLDKIVKSLDISEIRLIDLNGKTICTSNGLDKYEISRDKSDPSYACWNLLNQDSFLMLPEYKDENGNVYQTTCSTYRDENHDISGILMTKYDIKEKQEVMKSIDWYEYTKNMLKEIDIFCFIYDKKNDEFKDTYVKDLVGKKIEEVDLNKDVVSSDFQGLFRYKDKKMFGKTLDIDNLIIGVFIDIKNFLKSVIFEIIIFVVFALVLLLLYMVFVIRFTKNYTILRESIDIETEKEISINKFLVTDWNRITGSQKISYLVSYLFTILIVIFSLVFLYGELIFGKNSIINYIINGNWYHSLNILAFSKCVLILSYILLISLITNKLLHFLSLSFDARGVTICKLLANFVKYAAIFIALYQCLSLIGVDAKTLVASAGIISLVIGFGANKLIQEVVSGLFIIFEGSFQVGDIISSGGFTGVVKEIGIRNTKIASHDGNVMIVSNSKMDTVVNHSTAKTLVVYEYKIPKKILLDDCDKFFNNKLDYLKGRLGEIIKEIKYDGIVSYDVDTYTIRFSISCIEESKAKIEYRIDGEMKLLLNELNKQIENK